MKALRMATLALALTAYSVLAHAAGIAYWGDSISRGALPYLKRAVAIEHNGKCPYLQDFTTGDTNNAGSSARMVACAQLWLKGHSYTDVYFNAGMHDVHVADCNKWGFQQQVDIFSYVSNIQRIATYIKWSGARPHFITTTPVEGNVDCHWNVDIMAYNNMITQMLRSEGIDVIDIYSAVYPRQTTLHGDNGIHFTADGYELIGVFLAKAIKKNQAADGSDPD